MATHRQSGKFERSDAVRFASVLFKPANEAGKRSVLTESGSRKEFGLMNEPPTHRVNLTP